MTSGKIHKFKEFDFKKHIIQTKANLLMGAPESGKCVAVVATESDVSIAACEEWTNLGLWNHFPGKKIVNQ